MKVINYEIYNVKKNKHVDDEKERLIMHIDAKLEDDQGNKFELSVNDLDNQELTIDLFNLIGKKIKKDDSKLSNSSISNLFNEQEKGDSKKDSIVKSTKKSKKKKHKKIDSPETVIKVVSNSAKDKKDYEDLSNDEVIDNVELGSENLTNADFSNKTNNVKKDNNDKKEIDLTNNDGFYHEDNNDNEVDGFDDEEF